MDAVVASGLIVLRCYVVGYTARFASRFLVVGGTTELRAAHLKVGVDGRVFADLCAASARVVDGVGSASEYDVYAV